MKRSQNKRNLKNERKKRKHGKGESFPKKD